MTDELRLEWVPLSKLKEWEENPKEHALDSLVESFNRRGFRDALIIDSALGENVVIAGNGRLEALRAMKQNRQAPPGGIRVEGDEWLVPVQAGMNSKNEAEAKAWGIDHNNITMLGGDFTAFDIAKLWDEDKYLAALQGLAVEDALPVSVSGDDLDALLKDAGLIEPTPEPVDPADLVDKADILLEKWKCKLNDLWAVGEHRLLVGDSTLAENADRLFGSDKARLVWTDPPYGVKYGDKLEAANAIAHRVRGIKNDDLSAEDLENLIRLALTNAAKHSVAGAGIYVASPAGTPLPTLIKSFVGSGFDFRWGLVWVKDQLVLGRGDYHFKHENILYGWKPDGAHYFVDDRTQTSVFEYPRPKSSEEHPTMKPVGLIQRMIENSSKPDELIYDPFIGSGSTMLAAQNSGRKCYGQEVEPKYAAVVCERLSLLGLEVRRVEK